MTEPTQNQMRELLSYDPAAGTFHWLQRRGWVPAGAKAGTIGRDGYVKINVFGWPRKAHRIAWLLASGEWPPANVDIDHINGNRADNRLANLRLASRAQNSWNSHAHNDSLHGFKGLTWIHGRQKWQVRICVHGSRKTLGHFTSLEDAQAVYRDAARHFFGEYASYGTTKGRRRGNT